MGLDLFLFSSLLLFSSIFMMLQDMAVARICLTHRGCYIVIPMLFGASITTPGHSSDDQTPTPVGEGDGASRLGLRPVS